MIVRRLSDGRTIMDREALTAWLGTSASQLPLRGRYFGRDPETGVPLYDAQAVADHTAPAGPRRRGPRISHLIQVATRHV